MGSEVKIELDSLKDFQFIKEKNLTLIIPRKDKFDWHQKEKWFRSLLIDDNKNIISCGWPKFGNYTEFKDDSDKLDLALKNKRPIKFTLKEDGSLCIRFIYNGEVFFRSRGTIFGGSGELGFGDRFKQIAKEKYPKLLDPNIYPDRSLLFEYVGPDNMIVLQYSESDLIFLGFVNHNFTIGNWAEVENISKELDLNLVELINLPLDIDELLREIDGWEKEGVVARIDDTFVKIKSPFYLAGHRLKYSITYKFLTDLYFGGVKTIEDLKKMIEDKGLDWEVMDSVKKMFNVILDSVKIVEARELVARTMVREFKESEFINGGKKLFAERIANQGVVKSLAFLIYDGKEEKLEYVKKKQIVELIKILDKYGD